MRISVLAFLRALPALLVLTLLPQNLAAAQDSCEIELVLAMDVSRSVDAAEFDLIRRGTAQAFRTPEIQQVIGNMQGGVLATVTQWSGAEQQRQMIPWRHLRSVSDLREFADAIDGMKRAYRYELTAPGNALAHAAGLSASAPLKCRRRVIDIAGDGVRNTGLPTGPTADRIAALGVTINGLVVRGDTPDPLAFFRTEVRRGPLSFVEVSTGYEDFPRAMFLKLLRELSPSLSMLPEGGKG
jgi:Ca-activated chloride channel homolog